MIQFAIYVTFENLHRFGGVTTKTCTEYLHISCRNNSYYPISLTRHRSIKFVSLSCSKPTLDHFFRRYFNRWHNTVSAPQKKNTNRNSSRRKNARATSRAPKYHGEKKKRKKKNPKFSCNFSLSAAGPSGPATGHRSYFFRRSSDPASYVERSHEIRLPESSFSAPPARFTSEPPRWPSGSVRFSLFEPCTVRSCTVSLRCTGERPSPSEPMPSPRSDERPTGARTGRKSSPRRTRRTRTGARCELLHRRQRWTFFRRRTKDRRGRGRRGGGHARVARTDVGPVT
jgi:hypothetical protein